jgi:hypothetical protein
MFVRRVPSGYLATAGPFQPKGTVRSLLQICPCPAIGELFCAAYKSLNLKRTVIEMDQHAILTHK